MPNMPACLVKDLVIVDGLPLFKGEDDGHDCDFAMQLSHGHGFSHLGENVSDFLAGHVEATRGDILDIALRSVCSPLCEVQTIPLW